MEDIKELFLRLVSHNSQSAVDSNTSPSTSCQLDFCSVLTEECRKVGLTEIEADEYGQVTATLEANDEQTTPVIGFIAHMDTSPDCPGLHVKPSCISDYDGEDIHLANGLILSPTEFPHLKGYRGQELIVTDGNTLLGADDKAGIAAILWAMGTLTQNSDIKHGKIRIAFTPDEEVGHGVDHFDVERFGVEYAYTIDGGEIGGLQYESFNAARAKVSITGKSVHPGTAKGIMINAALVAQEILSCLPQNETPATTEGYEGFYHLTQMDGCVSHAELDILIRDFYKEKFEERKSKIQSIVNQINKKYGEGTADLELYDQYYNMREMLENKTEIVDRAVNAIKKASLEPVISQIRGGTDGSRLSFMGVPCPNIFTGGHNAHGPYEYLPVHSLQKAAEVVMHIASMGKTCDTHSASRHINTAAVK